MSDQTSNIPNFKSYNGNPLLKRTNVAVEWTPELFKEFARCKDDVEYFIENYVKIINVDEGLVPFTLRDYQKEMVDAVVNNRFVVYATARQIGKSTIIAAYFLWYLIFNSEKTVAILANKESTAVEILGKIQMAYQYLPKWLQQGVKEWNKGSFVLENNSRAFAAATSSDSIRGFAINCILIDEAAFIDNWDQFFTSTFPTITSGKTTQVILVSTPNGLNHFYDIVEGARKGKNDYRLVEVPWWKVPGRDEAWKETVLRGLNNDLERFQQENEIFFMGSSGTLISGWRLKQLESERSQPIAVRDNMIQFEKPQAGRNYVLVADVSRGKGLDYSAFHIFDVTEIPYRQVMVFRDNLTVPYDYAQIIFHAAKLYNEASVLIETNDIGQQVVDIIWEDLEYENVLSTENSGRAGKKISSGFGRSVDKGIRTTKTVKAIGCSILKLLIEQNKLVLNDKNTISELTTFSKKGTSYEAESGKHDDLAMGLVLFAWLTDQSYFKETTDINTLYHLKEKTEEDIEQAMTPFGFLSDGFEDEESIGSSYF